jgi:sec-independent protein translocase protein TatA
LCTIIDNLLVGRKFKKERHMLSMQDSLVILAIAALLFGGKKLPELGKGMGEALKNFKKSLSEPTEIDVTPKKDESSDQKAEKKEEK